MQLQSPLSRSLLCAGLLALAGCKTVDEDEDPPQQPSGPAGSCGAACAGAGAPAMHQQAPTGTPDAGTHVRPARSDAASGSDEPASSSADAANGSDAGLVDDALGPNGRPPGVELCYTQLSSSHAATQRFWTVFRSGALAERDAAIADLEAAATAYPDEEEFALLLGLAYLWRVAEAGDAELLNPLIILDSITNSQTELERAYALCPTDHRITAWLAPIKVRMGRMLDDPGLVQEGLDVLEQGIEHYPGFVLFSKVLVYADLPANDPDFLNAVDAVRKNVEYCGTPATGLSRDPACHNHPHASHNIEGAALFMGDSYAKAQDKDAALDALQQAMTTDTFESWDYQPLLMERISTLDARVAAAATESPDDDLESAWGSTVQCSLCHRD